MPRTGLSALLRQTTTAFSRMSGCAITRRSVVRESARDPASDKSTLDPREERVIRCGQIYTRTLAGGERLRTTYCSTEHSARYLCHTGIMDPPTCGRSEEVEGWWRASQSRADDGSANGRPRCCEVVTSRTLIVSSMPVMPAVLPNCSRCSSTPTCPKKAREN